MSLIAVMVYVFIIFFNFIDKFIPYSNYTDEFMCIVFIILGFVYVCKDKGHIIINKEQKKCIFCMLFIFLIGIFGNIIYGYMPSVSVILRDVMGTFKLFLIYLIGRRLIDRKNFRLNPKKFIYVAKIIIVIIFVTSLINLFVNTGVSDEVRYGIRSYKFIYSHYTYLVYNEVLLYSILSVDNKKNIAFKFMSLFSIAATLRTKGFIIIAFVLVYYLLEYAKRKNFSFKDIFKPIYIIPVVAVGYIISKSKIQQYLSWGVDQSIRVGVHSIGLKIANDHFPLGTGFGTFGTNISYYNSSRLYNVYNSLNYSRLMSFGYATMSDVYWPSIYVQFGYIGLILFVLLLVFICKDLLSNAISDPNCRFSALLIIFYMVSASIGEATFSNESGAFSALILLMIIAISRYRRPIENHVRN